MSENKEDQGPPPWVFVVMILAVWKVVDILSLASKLLDSWLDL